MILSKKAQRTLIPIFGTILNLKVKQSTHNTETLPSL